MKKTTMKKTASALLTGLLVFGGVQPLTLRATEVSINGVPYEDHRGDNINNKHETVGDGATPNADLDDRGAAYDSSRPAQDGSFYDKDGHIIAGSHESGQKQSLTVDFSVAGKPGSYRMDLTPSKDVFFNCPNINPGDRMSAQVMLRNPSPHENIEFSIYNVINLLPEDEKACKLLNELEIKIMLNGVVQYEGPYSSIGTPIMPWVTIAPNKEVKMDIEVYFPIECDNYYQNSKVFTKWIFLARGDLPVPNDKDTGDRQKAFILSMLIFLATLAAGMLLLLANRRKEEDE